MSTTVKQLYNRPTGHKANIVKWMRSAGADNEANRIEDCSKSHGIYWNITKKTPTISPMRCNSRWCPVCGKIHRDALQDRLRLVIKKYGREDLRFLTITQRSYPRQSLEAAGARFRKNLKRLYRTGAWKDLCKSWYIRYEADYNPDTRAWHYHAHLLVLGRYFPVRRLRKLWHKITGDSYLIDVRCIQAHSEFELAKYVSKIKGRGAIPLAELTDYCKHHRMYAWYGEFRRVAPPDGSVPEPDEICYMGTVSDFIYGLDVNILCHDYFVICQELYKRKDELPDICPYFVSLVENYLIAYGLAEHNRQTP